MTDAPTKPVPPREERLAARLRDNLRRRKEQARAKAAADEGKEAPSSGMVGRSPNDGTG